MSLSANETADSKGQQREGAQLPWRISDPGQPEFEDSVVLLTKIVHSKVDSSDRESLDEMAHKYAARLVDEFLSRDDDPELQFEAAWGLAVISSGSSKYTEVVIAKRAVPIFKKLLDSPRDDVRQMAVLTLGNFAHQSTLLRDITLEIGALGPLLRQFNELATLSMLRDAAFTLLNLCRGLPRPSFELVRDALPVLHILVYFSDEDVLTYACCALSYLSYGSIDKIRAVIEEGVCSQLMELLAHPSPCVLIPVLSTLRNIAKGDDSQRQCIIDHRVLHHLRSLLDTSDNIAVKKKACQTISAIAAGNEKQTQVVIDAKLIEPLTSLLKDEESSLKEDAVQAVRDVISFGTRKGINVLGLKDFVEPLCDLLVCSDPKILTVCLEGLSMLCKPKSGGALNDFVMWTDHCKGLDRIKDLKRHGNPDIRDIALSSWDMIYEEALKLWKFYDEMGELQVRVGS